MSELVLPLKDLDERGKDYTFPLTAEWLDQALADSALRRDPAAGEGQVHVLAQKNGHDVLVRGRAEADVISECARCLGDVPMHVRAEIAVLLSPGTEDAAQGSTELEAEDLDRGRFVGHEVVLDELVREHLLLEIPMRPLCTPDCAGIPVPEHVRPRAEDFGGPGHVDPRLLPLQQLRAKLSSKKE
ncbi:MAG: YceD family protein [Polyangiales bacterium]